MAECEICDYGLGHETWLRVRGVGEDVQKVLEQLNADAYHPVTWAETGLVPFHEGDIFFASKEALAQYYDGLMDWMSGASPWGDDEDAEPTPVLHCPTCGGRMPEGRWFHRHCPDCGGRELLTETEFSIFRWKPPVPCKACGVKRQRA